MQFHEVSTLVPSKPSRHRVGRGIGSGNGKTCGRGHKGAGSRSGHSTRSAFEGGQTAMFRRVAKRGYSNDKFSVRPSLIQLKSLNAFCGDIDAVINATTLYQRGLIPRIDSKYKIIGACQLPGPIKLSVHSISRGALRSVIEQGGQVEFA